MMMTLMGEYTDNPLERIAENGDLISATLQNVAESVANIALGM